jgi:hypothetical protein
LGHSVMLWVWKAERRWIGGGGRGPWAAIVAGSTVAPAVPVLSHLGGTGFSASPGAGADLLCREYDECLDALAEVRREEAQLAARKVRLVARCAGVARAGVVPGMSLQEQAALEMAFVAEVACVLTVSEPAAAGLLAEARELTTALP